MKYLITTIAAVVLVGCGESDHQHSHDHGHSHAEGDHDHAESDGHDHDKELKAAETATPEQPTAKAPAISIHDAARTGNIEAIKQHIAAGTHVDSELITGWTPLYFAAQAGYTEIAELLLSKGADVNAKTATGDTPLDQAIGFKHTEIVDLLRKHGGKHLTFHNAVLGGDVEIVKEFLAAGTDVNAMTDAGHTPLDLANPFRLKSTELADLLRKHGAKTAEELKAEGK